MGPLISGITGIVSPIISFLLIYQQSFIIAGLIIGGIGFIALGMFISSVNSFVKDTNLIRKKWPKIESFIEDIRAYLRSGGLLFAHQTSPVSLSETGIRLAERIKAHDIIQKYRDKLPPMTADMTSYSIQETCFDFAFNKLFDILELEDRKRVENVAYDEGTTPTTILRSVVGIPLRDAILAEKDIDLGELDKE